MKTYIMVFGSVALLIIFASISMASNSLISGSLKYNKINIPSLSSVNNEGMALLPVVTNSYQFKTLAHNTKYYINANYSFGGESKNGTQIMETIIFFSPDNSSYIVTDIYTSNDVIKNMYLNKMVRNVSFTGSGVQSPDWSGWVAQYCTNNNIIYCGGTGPVGNSYGNVQIPSTISAPSGAGAGCCVFGEWTGVSTDIYGDNLTQGGIAWAGDNQNPSTLFNSNSSGGFTFFVERLEPRSNFLLFLTPPSWFTGKGQTVTLETKLSSANCGSGGDIWEEVWTNGTNSKYQSIGCDKTSSDYYSMFIFESPAGCLGASGCYTFGGNSYFQLPDFSTVSFTGNICGYSGGSCVGIDTNNNPVSANYIEHNSQDTSTSSISNGNSWTIGWLSSS